MKLASKLNLYYVRDVHRCRLDYPQPLTRESEPALYRGGTKAGPDRAAEIEPNTGAVWQKNRAVATAKADQRAVRNLDYFRVTAPMP